MTYRLICHPKTGEPVKTRQTALKYAPEAVVVVKVEDGYLAFASAEDFRTWKQQR